MEASWIVGLSANLAVNLNQPLHGDQGNLALGKSVFQAVTKKDDEREGLTALVRARSGLWCPLASELCKHPVPGSLKEQLFFC